MVPGRGRAFGDVCPRAGREAFDLALARALAPPPVALELCLPLVRPGGRLIVWTGLLDAESLRGVAASWAAGHPGRWQPDRAGRCLWWRSSSPRLSASRGVPAWPGSVRSHRYHRGHELPRLRAREPEGRGRQDDHGDQPGGVLAEAGTPGAAPRPRPAGQRHHRPRRPSRAAEASTVRPAARCGRSTTWCSRHDVPNLHLAPSHPDLAAAQVELSARDTLLRDLLAGSASVTLRVRRLPAVASAC